MRIIMQRRDFLNLWAAPIVTSAVALGTTLDEKINAHSLTEQNPKRITFDEALADKGNKLGIRQLYINQLVREELGDEAYKYTDSWTYDHNGASTSVALKRAHIAEVFSTPKGIEAAVNDYSKDKRFSKLKKAERREAIIKFLGTDEAITEIADALREKDDYFDAVGREHAILHFGLTLGNSYKFDSNSKASIFLYRRLFEPISYTQSGISLTINPSEERIKHTVRHELRHAKHYFGGIPVDENTRINGTNHRSVDKDLLKFIEETAAYKESISDAKKFNEGAANAFPKEFGGYHPAYLESLSNVNDEINSYELARLLSPKPLDAFNTRLYETQTRQLNGLLQEINNILINLTQVRK